MDGGEVTEKTNGREQNTNSKVLEKVGKVIATINEARNVDQVICALHSLAVRLFSLDSRAFAGSIDKEYRDEVIGAELPSVHERDDWWQVFYQSTAFPTMARVLLLDVALNWLTCFPISAKKHLYDVFFLKGCVSEVVQTLVPYLQHHSNGRLETTICSNTERLLALCLLEHDGVLQLVREFSHHLKDKSAISRVAQLVTSVPDKARLGASTLLSSHLYIKRITIQLIQGAEEWNTKYYDELNISTKSDSNGSMLFIGDAFARICRRGSTDVLLSEVIPKIVAQVRGFLKPGSDLTIVEALKSESGVQFWSKLLEAIKDSYAVERISEQLLQKLATENINDAEGYWILWLLFHGIYELQPSIKSMFTERFLLWKVFPICCLRWILQFSVLQCPPDKGKSGNHQNLLNATQRVLSVWSKKEFVQSAPEEQQAYITAAVGLSLEKLTKEDLDATKDVMHLILQGVSCRLESPSHLVRKMASSIALVFSKVIDPTNPLYLDDTYKEDSIIDWEFTSTNADVAPSDNKETDIDQDKSHIKKSHKDTKNNELMGLTLIDPDEVIDPATLNIESASDDDNDNDDDDNSEISESSLQPYDLTDDDTDLKKNFSQLVDVVGALRKSDDADGVERALDVAESLIRASPDELSFIASDLVRTLVQVRCSDTTIEGEEDSAEDKRQKALVALIVNSPIGSLDPLHKLLYSPNVDTSQRIMILDILTESALELSNSKTNPRSRSTPEILTVLETQPWFMPRSAGAHGASPWKEISSSQSQFQSQLSLTYSYERDLPVKRGQRMRGKSRRWARERVVEGGDVEWSRNGFPPFAAAFMLPAMQGFDRKSHGVDFLGRDFIVLGKLVHMLGTCMKCCAMHPEASALALPLLDLLSSRDISRHAEAYVRKSVLFAASCVLLALNPTYVASALVEGSSELSRGLEWVRTWALSVAESDTDKECYMMAMACLQLHSEMALQTSRALESSDSMNVQARGIILPSSKGTIKISL